MGGNPDSDEFEEDDARRGRGATTTSISTAPSRTWRSPSAAASRCGEPAWRRLEQRLEQKRTAELISDFEDYDIGEAASDAAARVAPATRRRDALARPGDRWRPQLAAPRAAGMPRRSTPTTTPSISSASCLQIDPDRLEIRVLGHAATRRCLPAGSA